MKDVYQQIIDKDKRKKDKPKIKYPEVCELCLYSYDSSYLTCPKCAAKTIREDMYEV